MDESEEELEEFEDDEDELEVEDESSSSFSTFPAPSSVMMIPDEKIYDKTRGLKVVKEEEKAEPV